MSKHLKEGPDGRWNIVDVKGIGISPLSAYAAALLESEFTVLQQENTRLREAIGNHLSVADEIMRGKKGEHHGCWMEKRRFDALRLAAEEEGKDVTAICATCHAPYNDDGPTCGCVERNLDEAWEKRFSPTDGGNGDD